MVTIGDSYSAGSTADGNTSGGWPAIVAKQLGYQVVNTAIPGTGYVQGGPRNTPYAAQLAPAVAARPSLVLLSGGSRDGSNPGVGPAATSLLGELRSRLPTAKIVVVGVIWPDANPPTSSVDENNALRAAARLAGLPFVDALPANWLNPSLVGSEEGRPTRAGDQVLARRVLQDLARLGIGPTPATAASAAPR